MSGPAARAGRGTPGPRLSRRAALAAAGAVVGGTVLAGCGSTVARLTAAAASPIVITWVPWRKFSGGNSALADSLMQNGLQPWLAEHAGVRVRLARYSGSGATLSAMQGGQGPDVFFGDALSLYTEQNLALDLQDFVRSSGSIDLTDFSPSALDYFRSVGGAAGGLYALPAVMNPRAMAVNLTVLAQLGRPSPESGWTYQDWSALWLEVTAAAPGNAHRYGGNLLLTGYEQSGGNNPAPFYLHGFSGGYVNPQQPDLCYLNAPGSVNCLQWCYGLASIGVLGGDSRADIASGRQVSGPIGTGGDLVYAAENWPGNEWGLYAMPVWPSGEATYGSSDFYAVWAGTQAPDLACSLLAYLTASPQWQSFLTKLSLVGPSRKSLWDNWQANVLQWAPGLAKVRLDVFTAAVQRDLPYVGLAFPYASAAAASAINQYTGMAQHGTLSVSAAAQEAAMVVNQLQAANGSLQAASAAALQRVDQAASQGASSTPALEGSGNPPSLATGWLQPGPGSGTYRLLGDGAAIGGLADNCVFAGSAETVASTTFTCRLASLQNLTCPSLSPAAGAGLMVRGNLGDAAAMLALAVDGAGGVVLVVRPVGTATSVVLPASSSVLAGVVPGAPLWLRLQRQGQSWTGHVSLDGSVWRPAGSPVSVAMSGVWAGIYACANNGGFGQQGYVRAGLDGLQGFSPRSVYQIGRTGVPPAAGTVPTGWAQGS